ncbi:hypothetical protein EV127DRAFT_418440 [Xylaria flabelliformis]|nr:hypothetical protein EV127DRAFT_418440 [Xylaria flabelliformis]
MMYNSKALLSAALLTGASVAQSSSESSDAQCTQSYVSLLAGAPTPDGQLASAITSYASGIVQSATAIANPVAIATQVCQFSSNLPSSLQSDFDAYVTQVISYVSASSSAIDAVITNCVATGAEGAAYTSVINSFAAQTGPLCAAATGTTTGSYIATGTGTPSGAANGTTTFVTGTPTPSSTGVNGGGASSSSVPTGAAAMPTAVLGGAAAAAGLLGVIALL